MLQIFGRKVFKHLIEINQIQRRIMDLLLVTFRFSREELPTKGSRNMPTKRAPTLVEISLAGKEYQRTQSETEIINCLL